MSNIKELGGRVDYMTFVPDEEPLLDKNIGREVEEIKRRASVPVVVIINSSLLFMDECRRGLSKTNFVSLKVDALSKGTWRKVNRYHIKLNLSKVLQ